MKEFKPESILVSLSVERSAARLAEQDLKRYQLEKIRNAERLIEDPAYSPEFTDDLTGDLLEMAWNTTKAGIESARKKHFANPGGGKQKGSETHSPPIDPPQGTHSPPNSFIHSFNHSFSQSDNKDAARKPRFTPPTIEDVKAYCQERSNTVDPERFIDYYNSNGWMVGRNHMKDWKAAVRTWEQNQKGGNKNGLSGTRPEDRVPGQRDDYDF